MLTRRDLLKHSALLSLSPCVPAFLTRTARAVAPSAEMAACWSSCSWTGAMTGSTP